MKTRILSLFYAVTGVLFIVSYYLNLTIPAFVTKTLIMPPLMVIFILNLKVGSNRLHKFMFAGLFFSWIGDVLLEVPGGGEVMFMAGLGGFLLSLLMYAFVFFATPGKNEVFHRRFYLIIPVLLYGFAMGFYLYDHLGEMRLPVVVYETVMISMLAGAVSRIGKVNRTSYVMVLSGSILFIISDSVLAVNKFVDPVLLSTLIIMGTYIAAQWLITTGYIRQYTRRLE
jgi:uncharacterized membrane protein YhhN